MKNKVLETKYVMSEVLDHTDARVRVDGQDIWIRVGGMKTGKEHEAFLVAEAEAQMQAAKPINGARVM